MQKVLFTISIFCFTILSNAQDFATKIPYDASVVVSIKGKNVTDLMSVSEFSNSKIGKMIGKELSRETDGKLSTFEDLGLDLNANFYYFLEIRDGVYNNVFMVPMNNMNGFLSLLNEREKEKIETEGTLSYFQEKYDGMTTMWNNNTLVVIVPQNMRDEYAYNDYDYYNDIYIEETPSVAVEAEDAVEAAVEEVEEIEEVIEETVVEETIIEEVEEQVSQSYNDYYNSDEYKKQQAAREKRRLEQDKKREEARKKTAASTLKRAKEIITGDAKKSILKNTAYTKSVGKGSDEAVVWVNDFAQIYKNAFPSYMFGMGNPYEYMDIDKLYSGMTITGKLNFEKDQTAFRYSYTMNDELADLYKPMYEGKFNKNFLNYINEDKLLGYISLNISTEGTLKAYPNLIDSILMSGKGEESETIAAAASLVTRLFSLLIDEEGAAKIVRGDMLLLVTDLREKEVTYTDYEYDEDYNYKEVEKTKTETIPDFLFMFSSEEEKMFGNLMKIGIKEAGITYDNGIYKALGTTTKYPIDLYFMFKDNTVFLGSSKEHMIGIKNGTYVSKLSSDLKKDISKNVTSMYVNGGNIVSKIPTEAFPRGLRSEIGLITNNTRDFKLNMSKIKGNKMSGEMILKTPTQGHKNSFAYFINMIDELMD
ncbi:hypothetical protein [Costertonia aggregata]|uniref:DUF4836 family protein n=1 Tax=Costertonia aggregata TaxID=343403 RepID=A0A7H9APR9_9FLAO|nr:hypothetical protein [Costertonia aggregata]QLG45432.1 hypothetical protein HYG79_08765 [Costertonia aggregata]